MIQLSSIPQYLLESSFCLILFYVFYHFLLRKEAYFQFNRFYILFTALLAFLIPLFHIEITSQELMASNIQLMAPVVLEGNIIQESFHQNLEKETLLSISIGDAIRVIYYLGLIIMSVKFLSSLFQVFQIIKKGKHSKAGNHTIVSHMEEVPASSFFSYIFWKKSDNEDHLGKAILEHEKVHVRQWHSLDVVIMEIMVILKWFNPLIYLFRNALKRTHEYIADAYVSNRIGSKKQYANILLQHVSYAQELQLTNTFYSHIKERIEMLATGRKKWLYPIKFILVLPITIFLLALFSFNLSDQLPDAITQPLDQLENTMQDIGNTELLEIVGPQEKGDIIYEDNFRFKWGNFVNEVISGEDTIIMNYNLSSADFKSMVEKWPFLQRFKDGAYLNWDFELFHNENSLLNGNVFADNKAHGISPFTSHIKASDGDLYQLNINFLDQGYHKFYKVRFLINDNVSPFNIQIDSKSQSRYEIVFSDNGRYNMIEESTEQAIFFHLPLDEIKTLIKSDIKIFDREERKLLNAHQINLQLSVERESLGSTKSLSLEELEKFRDEKKIPDDVQFITSYYGGRSYRHIYDNYQMNDLNEQSKNDLKNGLSGGDIIKFNLLLVEDNETKSYVRSFVITDPDMAFNPPYSLDLPHTSDSYDRFQVGIDPEGKGYVKLDMDNPNNHKIIKAYKESKNYKLIHVPGFKTKKRVFDNKIPVGNLLESSNLNIDEVNIDLIKLPEYYSESDESIKMEWGKMMSIPGIGNFSLKEFRRSSKSEIFLWAGQENINTFRYDIVIVPETGEITRFRTNTTADLKLRQLLNGIDDNTSFYVENIIIEVEGKLHYYPYRFLFNVER